MVDTAHVNSLLRAAARLEPEELIFSLSSDFIGDYPVVDLPCFHRATSIQLGLFAVIRVPAGVEFPALETLYLACSIDALDSGLRVLHLSSTELNGDHLRVNSASLLELVVGSRWTRSVNVVAPVLKQLTMSLTASKISVVSVLAPLVEKVSWKCCYMNGCITFGLWLLEQVTLQTAERQGQLPMLHIRAHCVRPLNLLQALSK
ncbi:hypothetical protein CFC21_105555 [Triticum aestivum]|uniref:Uncharacterized protein n=3 Tax=Triticum TaxID=4564 RepID=A0A9R1C5R1_TRITD|nr:hypothetical protein CFC21_105555 [Triticum aestivum]VAI93333.1 unnamed protein product [Triticum turgidum subsp. durum]